jgi:hypothetical protein
MPPFKYEAFVNPYIGSISELMGKGDQAKAEALLRIGEIQARAEEQRGQAWGNAIQGLGNIASKAITDYNDPKLKMEKMALAQAEEDRKNEVRLGELMKRTEASTSTRVVDGVPVISKVDPRDMVSRQTSTSTPELSSRVPSTSFGKPFDVLDGGMARVGATSPSLVSTTTSRGAYEDEYGFFNYKKAHQDLINSGASPASAARVLESGQKTNTALSTYAAQTKAFAAAKTDMFGSAANTILKALDASPNLKVQDAIQQMLPMLRSKLPEAEYASLQQQILGMPEAEARQALTGLVDAMDAQNTKTEVSGTSRLVSKSGNVFLPAVPVTKPVDLQKASFGMLVNGKITNVEGSFDPSTGKHYYKGQEVPDPVNVSTAAPSKNSQSFYYVKGIGTVPLTEEFGAAGQPTRYFYEGRTGRREMFPGEDFSDKLPVAAAEYDPSSPKAQNQFEKEYRTILGRTLSARTGGLGLEDQKVNQAIHLLEIFDQTKDPKTGEFNIPAVLQNELALGLARLTSPTGTVGIQLEEKLNQATLKGDFASAITYLTGQPVTGSTQAIFKMFRDSILRQGKVAERNRESYFDSMRAFAPTELNEDRRKQLEAGLKLNRIDKPETQADRASRIYNSLTGGK